MKTSVSEIGKNRFRLSVEVPASDVERYLSGAYKRLAKEVRVPGFRPGKAPRRIIDQRLGKDNVRSEALREGLPEWYAEAVRSSDLEVVSAPEIDVTEFSDSGDLTFEALVDTRPEPELGPYEGLKVARPSAEVTDEEVDEQIDRLRTRFASLEVVERPIDEGDFALVDLTTTHHDEPVDGLTAKDFLCEVGAEMVVPELDEELKGKKKGDILKVNPTLGERFGERAGQTVSMSILVKEVKARRLPELDDDFATTVSEFDTFDELREDIRSKLAETKEQQAEQTLRERVLDAFVDEAVDVELPAGMIDLEIDGQIQNMARMLSAQGASIEAFMQHQGLDAEGMRAQFREPAERNLKLRLGLDAVAAKEGLEVSEADRTERVAELAERAGRDPQEVRDAVEDGGDWESVDGDILRSKALELVVERAQITTEVAGALDDEPANDEPKDGSTDPKAGEPRAGEPNADDESVGEEEEGTDESS